MTTTVNTPSLDTGRTQLPQSLMWTAAIALILFCLAGIGAIMGWIPTSNSHINDKVVVAPAAQPAPAQAAPARPAPARPVVHHAALAAPVHVAAAQAVRCYECGTVESVHQVQARGEGSGLGAVGGGVVGGLLGNQVGGGNGKALATVAGLVGGAFAGNAIEKRVRTASSYDVTVVMEGGTRRVFHETDAARWQAGDRVKLVDGMLRGA